MALQINTETGEMYEDGDDSGNFNNFTGIQEPINFNDFNPPTREVPGENVFDPTYGGTLSPVIGGGDESVFDPNFSSTLTPAEAAKLINADKSGILRKLFVDDKGNLNLKTLGGIGGGILGALGANTPNRQKSGYQGSIPKYDAVRNMITAPPTRVQGYRPGQGGINYGGDVSYVPRGTGVSAAQPSQAVNRAPADMAGIATGQPGQAISSGIGLSLTGLPSGIMPQPVQRPANAQPVSQDDLFYKSPEYKAFQNDPSNMMGTDDMYMSPYFGQQSSGSVGQAMDRAYEQYRNNLALNSGLGVPTATGTVKAAQGGLMKLAQGGAFGQQTVKNDDPFFSSVEFKALQNNLANMPATEDAYISPYFGQISSGSIGKALDEAYKQYQQKTQGSVFGSTGGEKGTSAWDSTSNADKAAFYAASPAFAAATQLGQQAIGLTALGKAQAAFDPGLVSREAAIARGVDPAALSAAAIANAAMTERADAQAVDAAAAEQAANMAASAAATDIDAASISGGVSGGGDTSGGDFSGGYGGDAGYGAATGGMVPSGLMRLAKGRYLQGETDGMADKIPAQIGQDQPAALSHGEFVVPADVVSHLGNGNSDAGAKKLYQMMDKIRTARINPDKFMPGGLASAYAAGGEVKKFAGETGSAVSGLGTAAAAGVTGSETAPNTFAGEYIADMLGKGQALANAPYQQYMGPLTAGESGLQSKVFGGLQSMNFPSNLGASFSSAGAYQPPQLNMGAYQQQPIGIGAQPGATTSPQPSPAGGIQQPQGIASQYMNPYLQNVLTPQMEELRRQAQINNLSGLGAFTKSGAFGGGRQAIMESEAGRNLLQEQNKTIGAGYSNAFDKAMSQFNTEQARDLGLAKFMSDQGGQQRGIEAEGIAADKAAFEAARENPYKMLQFQQSMLQGMPISATNIDVATPTKLQEILSGIGGGIKMVGNNPSNVSLKDVTDLLNNLGLGK